MEERLEILIASLREQRIVEVLCSSENVEEAWAKYRKIKNNIEYELTTFVMDFNDLCDETGKEENVLDIIKVKTKDAVLICILCYMTSIECEELVDTTALKNALIKASKVSLKERFCKKKKPKVARRLLIYLYKKRKQLYCLELEEKEFMKFFL